MSTLKGIPVSAWIRINRSADCKTYGTPDLAYFIYSSKCVCHASS